MVNAAGENLVDNLVDNADDSNVGEEAATNVENENENPNRPRRIGKVFKYTLGGLLLIGVALALWAFVVEPDRLVVAEYDLRVKNWSPQLGGFKIVAISDIHGGANFITEAKIRRIVAEANAQNPDLIVLLGDYVSQQHLDRRKLKMPMAMIAENLRGLNARFGVYAVLGNHDGWYDNEIVRRELERVGCRVLNDEAVAIRKDGADLRILGVADVLQNSTNQPGKTALAKLATKTGRVIILTHSPDALVFLTADQAVSPDAVLLLAGHTHGGQVSLPFVGAPILPIALDKKYARGFVRDKGIDVFITPGVGTSILPVRFGVPPEISVLSISAEENFSEK